jgi:hypothetical protein
LRELWKRITRGLPRERRSANDRAPTIEEIRRLAEYPDRRIKPTIYSMASDGFRVGAVEYLKWGLSFQSNVMARLWLPK